MGHLTKTFSGNFSLLRILGLGKQISPITIYDKAILKVLISFDAR
jgi:hypothetical protein